jgi:hypothetical protein
MGSGENAANLFNLAKRVIEETCARGPSGSGLLGNLGRALGRADECGWQADGWHGELVRRCLRLRHLGWLREELI